MLYIAAAMYIEAHPFIEYYHLKQDLRSAKLQVFRSETVTLVITGVGELKSAIALTRLLSKQEPATDDFFLNYGCCGSASDSILPGHSYICNKIKQQNTGYTVYPDLLDSLSFEEASITTCPCIMTGSMPSLTEPLVDMEAFGLYQAASLFFHTDQMMFLKTVTDHLTDALHSLSESDVTAMNTAVTLFAAEYEAVIDPRLNASPQTPVLSDHESALLHTITKQLHLSMTMQLMLRQHMRYYDCTHDDLMVLLNHCVKSSEFVTCHSKLEGKRYFERLLARLEA